MAEIELKFDEQELLPIHATKGSEIIHNLHSSSIIKGNLLNFEIKYTTESGRQFLQSDCSEYSNYEVAYNGFSSQFKPRVLKSNSAAILYFKSDISESEQDPERYIQVYRCNNLSSSTEECYQLTQLTLDEGNFDLIDIKPRTFLGTTVFFLFNSKSKTSYMFYIDYENKALNYETFDGKLIDASFIHTSSG